MLEHTRIRSTIMTAALAATVVAVEVWAQQTQSVVISAPSRTWVFARGVDNTNSGMAFYQDCNGVPTAGNCYRDTELGYQGIQFPGAPWVLDSIIITAGIDPSFPNGSVEFFLDAPSTGASNQMELSLACPNTTGTGSFCTMLVFRHKANEYTNTMWGGVRDLWVKLGGGGDTDQGAGNYSTFDFRFKSTTQTVMGRAMAAMQRPTSPVRVVNLSSRIAASTGALYDVHGRAITGSMRTAFHGVAITAGVIGSR